MPTKTEQADLNMALYGRHGESPVVVLAARSPADCFEVAIEAVRIATSAMTPVIVLSDGYIANASQAWQIPDVAALQPFPVRFATEPEGFQPYRRDGATLARPWAVPGTPGLEHRIGGLEKDALSGHISYDPDNHATMTATRAAKVEAVAAGIPDQDVDQGTQEGRLAFVGWGSTFGPISRAVAVMREGGFDVSHVQLRHLWPLPRNLKRLLRGFERVVVVENNSGHLLAMLRAQYGIEAEGLNKVSGLPFKIEEVEQAVLDRLKER
jgi:2-oxoglutarate ferredoxin oxidoreductase subunit alpha